MVAPNGEMFFGKVSRHSRAERESQAQREAVPVSDQSEYDNATTTLDAHPQTDWSSRLHDANPPNLAIPVPEARGRTLPRVRHLVRQARCPLLRHKYCSFSLVNRPPRLSYGQRRLWSCLRSGPSRSECASIKQRHRAPSPACTPRVHTHSCTRKDAHLLQDLGSACCGALSQRATHRSDVVDLILHVARLCGVCPEQISKSAGVRVRHDATGLERTLCSQRLCVSD